MPMDKYSVDQPDAPADDAKTSGKTLCPLCGADAELHGRVLKCPVHGTKPWEGPGK